MFANFLYSFTIWKLVVLGSIYNFKDFLKFNIFYNIIYVSQLYIKLVFFNCSVLIIIKNCNLKYFNSFYAHQLNYRAEKEPARHRQRLRHRDRDRDRGCCVRWLHKCLTWRMWHAFDHCCSVLPAPTPTPFSVAPTPWQVCDATHSLSSLPPPYLSLCL